jgi:hypothetical protein
LGKICHRLWENQPPILGGSVFVTIFGKNMLRLRKTVSVFRKNNFRFWEKQAPFLGKTVSVFGKNSARFWETQAPFLEKTCSAFGTKWFRFGAKLA